jgi:hypothetical protein
MAPLLHGNTVLKVWDPPVRGALPLEPPSLNFCHDVYQWPASSVQRRPDMGHGLPHFFVDSGSFIRYVVNSLSSPAFVLTHSVRNKVRRSSLPLLVAPLLTGMGISQHLRLHLMCSCVVHERVKGMEFVS